MIFAGIGSRETPPIELEKIRAMSQFICSLGFKLRSGGGAGADDAFEFGCDLAGGSKQIFLPWLGFRKNKSELKPNRHAYLIAREIKGHVVWSGLSFGQRSLLARNAHIILGPMENGAWTPVDLVVYYQDKPTPGTTNALNLAALKNIPCYNIGKKDQLDKLKGLLFDYQKGLCYLDNKLQFFAKIQ